MAKKQGIIHLLKPYRGLILLLLVFTLLGNAINLWLPKIISHGIDAYTGGAFSFKSIITQFITAVLCIFVFTYLQSIIQTYASERVAKDLRTRLSDKISRQSYAFIEMANPSKLLTTLTEDGTPFKFF